jgi:hypothetical protein
MAYELGCNFDEASGDVLDYSGNGRDFALNNSALRVVDGHTAQGISKNATGFCVFHSAPLTSNLKAFAFWLKGIGNQVWWYREYIAGDDTGVFGLYHIGGTLFLRLRKGGVNTNTTVAMPGDGLYHHYCGTYDGTNGRLYIDGVLVATSVAVTAPLDAYNYHDGLETSDTTQVMDDLRILSHVPTVSEIEAMRDTPVGPSGSAVELEGDVLSCAELTGNLRVRRHMGGSVAVMNEELGTVAIRRGLSGGVFSISEANGRLMVLRKLQGDVEAAAALSGSLSAGEAGPALTVVVARFQDDYHVGDIDDNYVVGSLR